MRALEVITALQELVAKHGNCEVVIQFDNTIYPFNDEFPMRIEFPLFHENNEEVFEKFELDDHEWDDLDDETRRKLIDAGMAAVMVLTVADETPLN